MGRPQCVLLDAGPVIFLHASGAWLRFCEAYEVVIPEIVAENEAVFHSRDELTGGTSAIRIRDEEKAGRVTVVSATSAEIADAFGMYSDDFAAGLHEGEIEAIALLTQHDDLAAHVFCSGDGAAIQAAVMAGLGERCLPLEGLLDSAGLHKDVPRSLSMQFFETHRRAGPDNRLSGLGMGR